MPRALHQDSQQSQRLLLNSDAYTRAAQFICFAVPLEWSEADSRPGWRLGEHRKHYVQTIGDSTAELYHRTIRFLRKSLPM